jgi:hypothetical protein
VEALVLRLYLAGAFDRYWLESRHRPDRLGEQAARRRDAATQPRIRS